MRGLENFLKNPALQEQDLVVVHFSGHGHLFEDGRLYLLCNQTEASEIDISAIEIDLIKRRLAECPARYKLLILDCCHAGSATEGARGEQEVGEELNQVLQGSSNVVLAACSRTQTTRELTTIDGEDGGGVLSWIVRTACTTRLREVSGDDPLSLKDIQHWIPRIMQKINSGLSAEERLPQPRTFYEELGGEEIWLTSIFSSWRL